VVPSNMVYGEEGLNPPKKFSQFAPMTVRHP